MAQPKLKDVLARIARELEDEELREEFAELKSRRASWEDVLEAIRNAPPEGRAELREIMLAEIAAAAEGDDEDELPAPQGKGGRRDAGEDDGTEEDNVGGGKGGGKKKKVRRRVRPGRRSGMAYDWYVDEETGEIVRSPVAVIYSGEDEPDEVEMLPIEEEGEEEEEE
jgi:hypothetical protein